MVHLMFLYEENFNITYPERVEIICESFFDLNILDLKDRHENQGRVHIFFKDIPKRAWTDDPVLTVVGTLTTVEFFKHLIRCFFFQSTPVSFGRIQIFAILKPKHYKILSANKGDGKFYRNLSVMFNLLFDHELLETFNRDMFLPWEKFGRYKHSMQDFDVGKMYLVKINFKKDFPVPAEHFIGLYHFIQQLYGRGNKCVIPLMEKFVPGSGFNAIVPSMNHKHFPKEVNIFTKFNELTPEEISTLFKETIMHPNYKSSPLMAMIEASFLKTELYDPYSVDDMEENIINEKMEMEEKF
ncbi:mitochondrial transcription factor B2 isoform X2 [Leptinotarsa decemlineata]|uniref:mitochondrial transcription factor B2 isoform X2 n=1 Tax=Leptinotarsa decemlineata TaxID=7539 RepID=UPI003D304339